MNLSKVTAPWIEDVLRRNGHVGNVSVTAVELSPIGTGQVADSYRATLTSSGADTIPESLVIKITAADEGSRQTGRTELNYVREVRFYQRLAPSLRGVVPQCYHAEIEANHVDFILVLEDLSPAVQGDQLRSYSPDECAAVLAAAASAHAPFWGDNHVTTLPWLNMEPAYWQQRIDLLPVVFEAFCERYGNELDPECVRVGEQLMSTLAHFYRVQELLPKTIQHGDFRPDNLLFSSTTSSLDITILDWQTVLAGPGLVDIAYFLGGAMSVDARRKHERDLVDEYHGRLVAAGVGNYSFQQCWNDYRKMTLQLYIVGMGASMFVKRTDRGDEMFLSMVESATHQINDLASLELLTMTP